MQKKQDQQGQQGQQGSNANPSSPGRNDQQNQSGGGRDQQGANLKSDEGQAQSRGQKPSQQGSDHGTRPDKQR